MIPKPQIISFPNAELIYYPSLFQPEYCQQIFDRLFQEIVWEQSPVKIFGRNLLEPH